MRADRLLSLLLLLQNKGRLTVAELAMRLDVSKRTVLRDVDALSGLGIPVYTDRGRTGGIRLLAGYATHLNALSPHEAEAMALVSAPSMVGGLGLEKPLASALQKISAAVPAVHQLRAQHARHRLLFDTTPWFSSPAAPPLLDRLRVAVWADQVCRLDYQRADGVANSYRVKPYALVAKVDVWYLVGDTARGMRVFRVARIHRADVTDDTFKRDPAFDLQRFWDAWCKRFEADTGSRYWVEMWLTPAGKRLLLDRFGAWHAAALADFDDHAARCRVKLDLEREQIAIGALMELGREATLIAPRRLRSKLKRLARELLAACDAAQ
jgi:predicted DNA-binding transcriptional regulator YafY